jgi:hypothetical protein
MQGQSSNHSQMFPTPTDSQGQTLPKANLLPPVYSSQLVNPSMIQMYPSQPLNLSYFPPNQEQFLNMRRPSMAPAPQHPNTQQTSWMTPAGADEEDSTHMAQDILWQTVKGVKRKKQGKT